MTAFQSRYEARQKLSGKWRKSAILTLIFSAVTIILSLVLENLANIGSILLTIITAVLNFGFLVSMFKMYDDQEVSYFDFFNDGFAQYKKVLSVLVYTFVKLLRPILLLILSLALMIASVVAENGFATLLVTVLYIIALIYLFIKSYSYYFALYVLYDNPDMTSKEAVEKSGELMKGNIGALFCLQLSFIGWGILAVFTLGIGAFLFTIKLHRLGNPCYMYFRY